MDCLSLAHSIRFAQLCPEIGRCIITTDDEEIANIAREAGGEVPFLRPPELAEDATPMLPVLQHAIRELEAREGKRYELVILLQPTSPFRLPEDVSRALQIMEKDHDAVGVVAVSVPAFNPRVVCVEENGGYLGGLSAEKRIPGVRKPNLSTASMECYTSGGVIILCAVRPTNSTPRPIAF